VKLVRDQHIEWLPQVPAQFQLMLSKGGLRAADLRSVRCLTWGGAPMPRKLIEQLQDWVPDLFNSYGLTECSGTITLSRPGESLDVMADTVGAPVDRGLVRIVDDKGQSVAEGECGEIQIRGRHLFHGYLGNEVATRATFAPGGWLKTGDLANFIEDGNIRLVGRTQEMFKSGGYNVYPREIEVVIESLQGVELSAVICVPDALWEEVGVAFVQADPDLVSVQMLTNHCRQLLAPYKVPKKFFVVDSLPLLPIGKVNKPLLRKAELLQTAQPGTSQQTFPLET
jgi:acyl-CoA synthetase (AMP-forming)/AMP-acid ligase II